jgi:hypothetical protein
MDTVNVRRADFIKILNTAELLVDEVEQALSQDEVAKRRMNDILSGKTKGKSHKEYYAYLKKRGIKVG